MEHSYMFPAGLEGNLGPKQLYMQQFSTIRANVCAEETQKAG